MWIIKRDSEEEPGPKPMTAAEVADMAAACAALTQVLEMELSNMQPLHVERLMPHLALCPKL